MVPNDSDAGSSTRRTLLRRGVGAVAAGFVAATAGCTSALPPLGSAQRFGRIDVPDADPPRYREWLPAPGAVDALDDAHYAFLFRRPGSLDYPAPVRFTTPRKRLLTDLDHFGIGYANYDRLLETDLGTAVEATVDPAAVAETLTDSGYAPAGSHRGFDLFARDDVPRRAAVGDGAVVWSSRRVHATPAVEALIDARGGQIDRYHAVDAGVERVTDAIGECRMVEYLPPSDARDWKKCEGFRFDGRTAYHVMAFLFADTVADPERRIRKRSFGDTVLTREVEHSDLRIDGRLVTVEGRIPPGKGVAPDDISPPYPPQITWGYDRRTDPRALVLRHEAGAPVPVDALHLRFETDEPDPLYSIPEASPLPTDTDRLAPGDTVTVELRETPTVRVIHPDDIDWDAENEFAAADPRPATRMQLAYAPESSYRPLFEVPLEGSA
jgi:hypothetical protein